MGRGKLGTKFERAYSLMTGVDRPPRDSFYSGQQPSG